MVFPKNPSALSLLSKVPPCTVILLWDRFFNLIIWKPMDQAFQNTLTFYWYLFNSRSNFNVNLVHWNSLHPKKASWPNFSEQTPHFLSENNKTGTNNLHPPKTWSVAVILSLRLWVQNIQKEVQWCFQRGGSRMYNCILQGLLASRLYKTPKELYSLIDCCLNIFTVSIFLGYFLQNGLSGRAMPRNNSSRVRDHHKDQVGQIAL